MLRALVLANAGALALAFTLSLVLIPTLHARGAAITTAALELSLAGSYIALLWRRGIRPPPRFLACFLPALALALGTGALVLAVQPVGAVIAASVVYFGTLWILQADTPGAPRRSTLAAMISVCDRGASDSRGSQRRWHWSGPGAGARRPVGELIVALNGIDVRVAGVPPGARTVDLGVNRGVAPGWNSAARAAQGELLVFCNDDVELGEGSLAEAADVLGSHPDAGVVGSVGSRWDLTRGEHRDWVRMDGRPTGEVSECEVVSGFLFACRRDTWDAVGGFDERYAPASWEEVDFCTAVRATGRRCYAVAGVQCNHEWGVCAVSSRGREHIGTDARRPGARSTAVTAADPDQVERSSCSPLSGG